ncbi:MAG: hypothetical protein ABSG98_03545 [Anaerolineales bacterium]
MNIYPIEVNYMRREGRLVGSHAVKSMAEHTFNVGELVEVLCDHKRSGRRVRDWVQGVIVHADARMTAVQFRSDVYLTDGWMVPDRILWFTRGSQKIRPARRPRLKTVGSRLRRRA